MLARWLIELILSLSDSRCECLRNIRNVQFAHNIFELWPTHRFNPFMLKQLMGFWSLERVFNEALV